MTDQGAEPTRTIVELTVDSFMRLKAARVAPPSTGVVEVRGRNRQGKSSLLDSILAALRGKKGAVELPIHDGAHAGSIRINLGDIVVEKVFTRGSTGKAEAKLRVTSNGSDVRGPQGVLDSLTGGFADPIEFDRMKPEEQARAVIAALGIGDELERLEVEAAKLYDERRDLGRDAERLKKTVVELSSEVEGLPAPPAGKTLDELVGDLQAARDHNEKRGAAISKKANIEREGASAQAQIEELEASLERARTHRADCAERWKVANSEVEGLGHSVPVDHITAAIKAHEEAQEHEARRRLLEEKRAESENAEAEHEAKEEELGSTRRQIGTLLANAPYPLEGMSYDNEAKRILINGIPLSQASQAERLQVAAAVAMAGDPSIRVMIARDGSLLDEDSKAMLATMSEERGFQLWLEVVGSSPEGAGVYIEDGEVVDGGQ